MSPTAPAGETAQRSKRLSTSITAITSPGGRRISPARCVSQYTCLRMSSRSSLSLTIRRSRGSIRVYQTAESYWSVKHCASAIALATTASSCGSRCWSASARGGGAPARTASITISRGAISRGRTSGARRASGGEARSQEGEGIPDGEFRARALAPVPVLELPGLEPPLRDDEAVRDPEELGVGELDPRACVAVVVEHL